MHNIVLRSLRQLTDLKTIGIRPLLEPSSLLQIQVPQCHRFITADDDAWWARNLGNFPDGYSPCNVIHSERIPPMHQDTREILIERYCPKELVEEIKASDANRDSLVRPYLGRRRVVSKDFRPSRFKAFSLRNFPLHLDQMEELGISDTDMQLYAKIMAEALAMMHWYGEIDANDVEFVLAPSSSSSNPVITNVLGPHVMWILDFDCCRKMSMDERGIEQAVTAFLRNDPFYPRPGGRGYSQQSPLWRAFRDRYLQTSSVIIRSSSQVQDTDERIRLPRLFIERIEQTEAQEGLENRSKCTGG